MYGCRHGVGVDVDVDVGRLTGYTRSTRRWALGELVVGVVLYHGSGRGLARLLRLTCLTRLTRVMTPVVCARGS